MTTFILILIGSLLIVFNLRAVNKTKNSGFYNILKEEEENMNDYDLKLGEIRREYAENITEIQREIETLKEEVSKITKQNEKKHDIINDDIDIEDNNTVAQEDKIDIIRELLSEGKSDDDICMITGLGKGEVLLIKSLLVY